MRIAIINISGGGISGGYKKYLCNLIPRIAANSMVEDIMCVSPVSWDVQSWFSNLSEVKFENFKASRTFNPNSDPDLHKHLKDFTPDVIFVPVERFFRFNEVPIVNMLQNMEPFVGGINGNPLIERIRLKVRYLDGKKAISRSCRIIALSKFVLEFLLKKWKIPRKKISLIYHGINSGQTKNGIKPIAVPESWSDQFLFTAGSVRPARGLEDLLAAMKYLASRNRNPVKLVIAGNTEPRMNDYKKRLAVWSREHHLSDHIMWVDGLSEMEMTWCYQNCRAFVMTSRIESFGMIGGEALANGCICIAADNPCLPEIFGDAAIYYPPQDAETLARAIKSVTNWDDSRRIVTSEKARKRAAFFSWDVCAQKTAAELVKAAFQ